MLYLAQIFMNLSNPSENSVCAHLFIVINSAKLEMWTVFRAYTESFTGRGSGERPRLASENYFSRWFKPESPAVITLAYFSLFA